MILLAAAILSSTLLGYLAVRIFLPVYKPAWADLTLKICLGFGVGAGLASSLFFLTRLLPGPSTAAVIMTESVLLGGAAIAFRFARDTLTIDITEARPAGRSWLMLAAFLGALAVFTAVFVDGSAANPHGAWDAWSIWNLRAKFLAQPDATWRRAFSASLNHIAGGGARHPEYPLLLSGYIARCWVLMGSIGAVAAPIATAGLFSFATVGLLVSALAILRGFNSAMAGGLVLLATAGFLTDSPWQYADVPLAFYFLAAFAAWFLADSDVRRRGRIAVLTGVAAGLAAWTKDEGMLFMLVLGLAFAFYVAGGKPLLSETLRGFAAGAAPPAALVLSFRLFVAPPIATPVSPAAAAHQLTEAGRYLQIARAFWSEGSGLALPLLSLLILGGCLGVPSDRRRKPVLLASSAALLTMFVAYGFAYVVTPMDLTWHLSTSLGRLWVQLWPSFVFIAVAAFNPAQLQAPQRITPEKGKKRSRS
ncbi:MAG TPA: hypothetical protein VL285_02010 [Bryobacteraceae bacterium]|nr:hypothetical protein [Bryobacteraceae bacterium]